MAKIRLTVIGLCCAMLIGLAGCSADENYAAMDFQGDTGQKTLKIGIVTDTGGIEDHSFNELAWNGAKLAEKKLNVKSVYINTKKSTDFSHNLQELERKNQDLIWGIGFLMADAIKKEAEAHPDQKYAIIDNSYGDDTLSNVVGITFKENESSFLVGYIAGKMTKSNKVGFIGGVESDLIKKFQYGFMAGVRYANPKCRVLSNYAGSFSDPAAGKKIALNMYGKDADIIFHAAGATGNGLIDAAKQTHKYCIGVDSDQSVLAPENVLTSAMKNVDQAVYKTVDDLKNGVWNGGATIEYGLAENGVGIAPTSDRHIPKTILNQVAAIKAKIVAGEFEVPMNEKQYNAMFKS